MHIRNHRHAEYSLVSGVSKVYLDEEFQFINLYKGVLLSSNHSASGMTESVTAIEIQIFPPRIKHPHDTSIATSG
ncbi:UNVERIFIED_CONTAM: hypothetical protein NCL1_50758 [Trichonephila clavipes]